MQFFEFHLRFLKYFENIHICMYVCMYIHIYVYINIHECVCFSFSLTQVLSYPGTKEKEFAMQISEVHVLDNLAFKGTEGNIISISTHYSDLSS